MGRRLLFLLAVLLARPVSAQIVSGDAVTLNAGPCTESSGAGAPTGGNVCDSYKDNTTGLWWIKTSAGWITWSAAATANAIVSRDANADTAARNITAAKLFGGAAGNALTVGGTGGTCSSFASCEALAVTLDTALFTQRLKTDVSRQTQWYVNTDGAHLTSSNGGGWAPLLLGGGPTQIVGGGLHVGQLAGTVDAGVGNALWDGWIHSTSPAYTSQTTGMAVDFSNGSIDAQYIYANELHAKSFIADLEQALAGGQIISKSVAKLGAVFTAPAAGSISVLTVQDLPSATGMAVFESGDFVRIREFSRAGGSLSITDAWGVVTGYSNLGDCGIPNSTATCQTWNFQRAITNSGAMTAGTTIGVDAIVLDYGVSGNGFYEVNAIDGLYGVNSPYAQIVTWAGNSPYSGNQTVRARFGNLTGITGTAEYGLLAGTYAATNGQYFVASDQHFELHGIDLSLWNGSTRTLFMNHTAPYWSMGNPAPTSYSTGVGCWSGMDAGAYKWRCGDPAGQYIAWSGSTLIVNGDVTVTGLVADDTNHVNGVASATVSSGAARAILGIDSNGNPLIPHVATPSGAGLYLSSDHFGYYDGGAWKTFMDSSGDFYLGGTSGSLTWNGSTLAIAGQVTATSGAIGGFTIGTYLYTGSKTAYNDGLTGVHVGADGLGLVGTGTFTVSAAGVVTATSGTIGGFTMDATSLSAGTGANRAGIWTGTQAFWAGNNTPSLAPFQVYHDGTLIATNATISGAITATSGSFTGNGAGVTNINGGNIQAGTVTASQIAAGTITADRLSIGSLSAISANIGNITAGNISGVNLSGVNLSGSSTISLGGNFYVDFLGQISARSLTISGGNLKLNAPPGGVSATVCVDGSGNLFYVIGGYC